MKTKEENKPEESKKEALQDENPKKSNNKFLAFLKNNKAATFLSLLLVAVFIWFYVKMEINEKKYNNEKTQLISQYESRIDSLQINHLEFATKVFSWSVRSELLRNNTENINQLLTVFVKESGADLVQIVNPEDKMVLLSTDKKYEGSLYSGDLNGELNNSIVSEKSNELEIRTQIMGLNKMIGVLIVKTKIE